MNLVKPASGAHLYSIIFGLIAVLLNVFLISAPIGLILGIAAFVCGLIARSRDGRYTGLVIASLSFLILLFWACSVLIPLLVDPTLQPTLGGS